MNGQSNGTRILSSNPDEIFVEDKKSDKWISLTEYNKNFSSEKAIQLYARKLCIVTINGSQVSGEVCGRDDYSNCTFNNYVCVQR